MANRAAHIPNGPQTQYGLANATTTALLTAVPLQGTWPRLPCCRIPDSRICGPSNRTALVIACPAKWRRITVSDLVRGTSRLPNYRWGRPGNSVAQTEAACASLPLGRRSPPSIAYTSCANVVMALLAPDVTSSTPGNSWVPTGLIPLKGHSQKSAWGGHVRRLGWQLFDGLRSRWLALDYSLSGSHQAHTTTTITPLIRPRRISTQRRHSFQRPIHVARTHRR